MRRLYSQKLRSPSVDPKVEKQIVHLVLDHAKKVIAHPSKPTLLGHRNLRQHPDADLALEETLEENPHLSINEDFLVEHRQEKPFSCVALLDCSSSMSGEKHLLASIAVAVLLLEVPSHDVALVVFASDARAIKKLKVEEVPEATILRFLKVRPKGFTNIGRGLEEGLGVFRTPTTKRKIGLIATDGRTTEGEDPLKWARQFDFLVVLHLHGPGSHLEASKELAQSGHGICLEVEKFEQLPRRLYEAIRKIAR